MAITDVPVPAGLERYYYEISIQSEKYEGDDRGRK
jgi:hypothetical protein